jgi:hypothetical protein
VAERDIVEDIARLGGGSGSSSSRLTFNSGWETLLRGSGGRGIVLGGDGLCPPKLTSGEIGGSRSERGEEVVGDGVGKIEGDGGNELIKLGNGIGRPESMSDSLKLYGWCRRGASWKTLRGGGGPKFVGE